MKKIVSIFIALSLFSACSSQEQEVAEEEQEQYDEPTEELTEEKSESEKLIEDLPASAELEAWNLILVNPEQALDSDFSVDLVDVGNEKKVDRRIVDAWTAWKEAASEAGHRLFLASSYRDIARQEMNFNQKVKGYINDGLSEAEAKEKAKEYLTEPGHSEHHTGLALDIVDEEWIIAGNGLETAYENELSQQWLMETKAEYGFILRYPEGKEDETMIEYEPWHFRYVGTEHAAFMEKHDLVLEEYIELIKQANR